jgi:hypothetical protein
VETIAGYSIGAYKYSSSLTNTVFIVLYRIITNKEGFCFVMEPVVVGTGVEEVVKAC